MASLLNPAILLQMLRQQGNPLGTLPITMPSSPMDIAGGQQPAQPIKPDASGGMLSPAGVAPGGQGTGVGAIAGPKNPNIINDPNELRETVTRMLQAPAPAVQMPAAPQYPAAPELEPRPTGWGPRAVLERITGAMAGMGGQMNPFEVQRREREQVAQQHYATQVGAIQNQWKDKLQAAEAQQKAELERYQAQRQMLMGLGYALPAFGISRTGAGGTSAAPKVSNLLKFNQGMPVSVTDPDTGSVYPVDPTDKNLSRIPNNLKPLVLAAQRQHAGWYNEQQKLIQTRGEAFRLNTMYPVLDAEDGMAPIYARGYEILNNPGRYNAGSLGQMAMNRQNILMDIGDLSKTVRADFHTLDPNEEFSAEQRAMIAAALSAPAGQVGQYIESFPRMGMTAHQTKLATDLIQLKENAMALRGILPGGTTETMRAAVANTLPGAGTPSVPYADAQLDTLDAQIARLSRGIPRTPMRTLGGNIPQASEGGPAPAPARGPIASQPSTLNIQNRAGQGPKKQAVARPSLDDIFNPK